MNAVRETSSLSRVLEPEAMDTPQEAHDYDTMDHGQVNRAFASYFLAAAARAGVHADEPVLDVGTGTALIPIELCAQNPAARVTAVDLADEMLRLARRRVDAAGLHEQIALKRVDAKRMPFADCAFAAVMSNSIVHHIPEPYRVLEEIVRVARGGGVIFVRDLARPYDEAQVRQLVDVYAADCNAHQRQLFDDSLRAALSLAEIRDLIARLGADPAHVTLTSDRHWTWSTVRR